MGSLPTTFKLVPCHGLQLHPTFNAMTAFTSPYYVESTMPSPSFPTPRAPPQTTSTSTFSGSGLTNDFTISGETRRGLHPFGTGSTLFTSYFTIAESQCFDDWDQVLD